MALTKFNGPTGVVIVGDELARVYRKTPGYTEVKPDTAKTEAPAAGKGK